MNTLQQKESGPQLIVRHDEFPLDKAFRRGGWDKAHVVTVEITDGSVRGRGESVPVLRYGETIDEVIDTISSLATEISGGLTRRTLQHLLPVGAARSAIDLALWDLDSKRSASAVWTIGSLPSPRRITTSFTLPIGTPNEMAAYALAEGHRPSFRLELGKPGDFERIAAVRLAVPHAGLILDIQEGWNAAILEEMLPKLAEMQINLIVQPLPAGADESLRGIDRKIPVCADISCRDRHAIEPLTGLYDAICIKLDKMGGFTEALATLEAATDAGFQIMVGGTLSTSLALAPAVLLAQDAKWVALDAALLLARDRQPGLRYDGSVVYPPNVSLWG